MQIRVHTVGEPGGPEDEFVEVIYIPAADPYIHVRISCTDEGERKDAGTALDITDARLLLHALQVAITESDMQLDK